jgi:hypothetical protein
MSVSHLKRGGLSKDTEILFMNEFQVGADLFVTFNAVFGNSHFVCILRSDVMFFLLSSSWE